MQNLGSVMLIPQRDLELLLGDGSLPQGFVNEYNFTATKEAMRTEVPRGENSTFFFLPSKSNFLKSPLFFFQQTHSYEGPDILNVQLSHWSSGITCLLGCRFNGSASPFRILSSHDLSLSIACETSKLYPTTIMSN